jgi:hypothetical protein
MTTLSTVFGKFSKDWEIPQNLQVNARTGIGLPHCSQSLLFGAIRL